MFLATFIIILSILAILIGQVSYFINEEKKFYVYFDWLKYLRKYISIFLLLFLIYFLFRDINSDEFIYVYIIYAMCCIYVIYSDFNPIISKIFFYIKRYDLFIKGIFLLFYYKIYIIVNQEIVIQTGFSATNFSLSQIFIALVVSVFYIIIAINYIFMVLAVIYELIFFWRSFKKDNNLYDVLLSFVMKLSDSKKIANKYYWAKYLLFLRVKDDSFGKFRWHYILMVPVLMCFVFLTNKSLELSVDYIKEEVRNILVYSSYQPNINECELVGDKLIAFVGTNLVSTYDEKSKIFSYSECTSKNKR